MSGDTPDRAVAEWLRRLTWALGRMPAPQRDDIVAEVRAHIEEATASGRSPHDVLAGFGDPAVYARPFLDEMELASALGSGRPGDLFAAVLARAHRSLLAVLALAAVTALGVAAFTAVSLVIMKLQDPAHVGLWIGPRQQFIGVIDDPSQAREYLGGWLYPLAALVLTLAAVLGRLLLLWSVRRLARAR